MPGCGGLHQHLAARQHPQREPRGRGRWGKTAGCCQRDLRSAVVQAYRESAPERGAQDAVVVEFDRHGHHERDLALEVQRVSHGKVIHHSPGNGLVGGFGARAGHPLGGQGQAQQLCGAGREHVVVRARVEQEPQGLPVDAHGQRHMGLSALQGHGEGAGRRHHLRLCAQAQRSAAAVQARQRKRRHRQGTAQDFATAHGNSRCLRVAIKQ